MGLQTGTYWDYSFAFIVWNEGLVRYGGHNLNNVGYDLTNKSL